MKIRVVGAFVSGTWKPAIRDKLGTQVYLHDLLPEVPITLGARLCQIAGAR